jgi:predicted RNA-binding protein with PUA-like domain
VGALSDYTKKRFRAPGETALFVCTECEWVETRSLLAGLRGKWPEHCGQMMRLPASDEKVKTKNPRWETRNADAKRKSDRESQRRLRARKGSDSLTEDASSDEEADSSDAEDEHAS